MISETPSKRTFGPCLARLLAVLSLAYLQACSTTGTPPITPPVLPDEACLSLADPLPPLMEPSLAAAIRNHVEVADLYWQLAARQKCLADFERGRLGQ